MAEPETKAGPKAAQRAAGSHGAPVRRADSSHPFYSLRREIDRLFEDFPFAQPATGIEPFWRGDGGMVTMPAVDIVERDDAYEITAELPGMAEKDVEVSHAGGRLVIRGEKKAEKEEKKKGYHLSERQYGSFHRAFAIPDGVDADRIEAQVHKGVLTVTLPKTPEAKRAETRIPVKSA